MKYVKILLSSLILTVVTISCTTVTPPIVQSSAPSWDGTNNNSGFIGWSATGEGIITPHAQDRYNALIVMYGKRFVPPLVHDFGITTTTNGIIINNQALSYFAQMNRWFKTNLEK